MPKGTIFVQGFVLKPSDPAFPSSDFPPPARAVGSVGGRLETTLAAMRLRLADAGLASTAGGVLMRLDPEDGVGGWVLPMADLAGTATPGSIARSAYAPPGIVGITGLRGQVLTVVDARFSLLKRLCRNPQGGVLTILNARWGEGWSLLWPEMVGQLPSAQWQVQPAPEGADPWITQVWYDDQGAPWNELNVGRWMEQWASVSPPPLGGVSPYEPLKSLSA